MLGTRTIAQWYVELEAQRAYNALCYLRQQQIQGSRQRPASRSCAICCSALSTQLTSCRLR